MALLCCVRSVVAKPARSLFRSRYVAVERSIGAMPGRQSREFPSILGS
jgi:hypothetical protein